MRPCGKLNTKSRPRVRKGGQDTDRTTGNMVWAEFIHTNVAAVDGLPRSATARSCFTFKHDLGRRRTPLESCGISGKPNKTPRISSGVRVRLVNKLQDLGFGIDRKRDDFEIAGIPADVLKRFSRRTALIEKLAKERASPIRPQGRTRSETREKKETTLGWKAYARNGTVV